MQLTERANLSGVLEAPLRGMVVRGELPSGQRINEVHLARALAVSRTPLREALTRLAGEDFIESRPRQGFFVRTLSAAEVRELYPIRAKLDPWALELAGIPDRAALDALDALNDRIPAAGDVERVIELDDEWHVLLLARGNQVLLDLVRQMMWRTRRYEYAYFQDTRQVSTAHAEHRKILAALRRRDLRRACRRLEDNMTSALAPLLRWLERERKS